MIFLDFYLLIVMLLPVDLQKPFFIQYIKVFTDSIDYTQTQSTALFDEIKYNMIFNELTIYIEHYLNDQHDNIDRGIYIEDVEQDELLYIFNEIEGNELVYIFNNGEPGGEDLWLFNSEEIDNLIDFIVYVPAALTYDENLLKFNIEKYKLPGMSYQILTY
jgi:hypothetical protein